jgi:hypothetical protein
MATPAPPCSSCQLCSFLRSAPQSAHMSFITVECGQPASNRTICWPGESVSPALTSSSATRPTPGLFSLPGAAAPSGCHTATSFPLGGGRVRTATRDRSYLERSPPTLTLSSVRVAGPGPGYRIVSIPPGG